MTRKLESLAAPAVPNGHGAEFVTVTIAGQVFGIPVQEIHDVVVPSRITRVPLAPSEIAGIHNLRGRIVTAIDVRRCLNLPAYSGTARQMAIVVEFSGETYSLIVDGVGEVKLLKPSEFEPNLANLDPRWRHISAGLYRLPSELLIVFNIGALVSFSQYPAAA